MKTRNRRNHVIAELRAGAWYSFFFGYERHEFCVLAVFMRSDGHLYALLENPRWNFRGSMTMPVAMMFAPERRARFMGYGRFRPIGSRIRRWLNCWCSIYTKPRL